MKSKKLVISRHFWKRRVYIRLECGHKREMDIDQHTNVLTKLLNTHEECLFCEGKEAQRAEN